MNTMETIRIDQLQLGVFISLSNLGWMNHPFLHNDFCIASKKQIHALYEMGVKEVFWDPARSKAQPLYSAAIKVEEDFAASALSGMLEEKRLRIERIREIREQFARCEREYEKDAGIVGTILQNIDSRPVDMHVRAKAIVGRVVSRLNVSEREVIHLINTVAKDVGPASHSVNVMVLSLLLGKALGLSEEEMKLVGMGAMLHDAGHAAVPPRILRSGNRTKPEEEFYRGHVAFSIKAVSGMRELEASVRNIIACHHERWDGSGYPNRLAAEKIPRLARLVALANRYDNLCNPLEAQQAKTPAETIAYLFKKEASHFQPEIFQTFVKMLGIYPPGSFVMLSNGSVGLVIESNATEIMHPLVMVYDPEIPRAEAILLDLRDADIAVESVVNPGALPVQTVEYLAPRGRVDYYLNTPS